MSERRWEFVSVKFASAGLLVAALSVAPAAFAQGQSGAAAPAGDAAGHSQNSSAAKTPGSGSSNSGGSSGSGAAANSGGAASSSSARAASGQNPAGSSAEPEMVDQSAPAGDSLAEAARQARARKAKAGAAGAGANAPKVYTEDKLSQLSGHGVSVVGDGNAGGSGSSGDESSYSNAGANSGGNSDANGAGGGGANGEQYWRGRAKAIHDQMARCDQEISNLQDEIAKYGAVSVDPQSGAMQSIIYVNDRNAKIRQIEEQKAGLQAQLDALEDEGRKAGADSGWFR
ncbi:MAG: hypothetical protein WAN72_11655 [Candidatus Acidiferrales bacterium]